MKKNIKNAFKEMQKNLVENLVQFVPVNRKQPKFKTRKIWIDNHDKYCR